MGERERLEQEHADKMRDKKRDASDVKIQFQIDSYKKVFAEQRLVVEHIGTASRKLVRQMDPLFGCAAPLPAVYTRGRPCSPNHVPLGPLRGQEWA